MSTPQSSPIEPTPFYGFRSWVSQVVVASFIAGGTAGAVSRTVVSPLERLKILLQVQNVGREEYKMSIGKALGKMWREEGWRGMMAGNGANCMRIVPYSAVQFGSYNIYKKVRLDFLTTEVEVWNWKYKRQAAAGIEQWALATRNGGCNGSGSSAGSAFDPKRNAVHLGLDFAERQNLKKGTQMIPQIRLINCLTGLRIHSWREPLRPLPPVLWCTCRHHLSHRHIPTRHRSHAPFNPVRILRIFG
jgi:hypothetical protein